MTVNILYFAHFSDLAGATNESITLPEGATIASLCALLASRDSRLGELLTYGRAAVNAEWAIPSAPLSNGDEVAFMPPMSGG